MRIQNRPAGRNLNAATQADTLKRTEGHDENASCFRTDNLSENGPPVTGRQSTMISNRQAVFQTLNLHEKTDDGRDTTISGEVRQPIQFVDDRLDQHRWMFPR